jgi:hypothetical protein
VCFLNLYQRWPICQVSTRKYLFTFTSQGTVSEFRTIFEKINDPRQAERFLRAWIWKANQTGDRYLAKFLNTLRNWWSEILRYFDDHITNGFVEGMNRAIRAIIGRAYGYRNFDNFRLQVLAQHGPPVSLPTIS